MEKCSAVRKENAVKKRRILEDFARILERKKTPQFRKTAVLRHKNGAPQGIRTPDLLVRSQTLYPTELAARIFNFHDGLC
jgi:hypothetical protein